MMKLRITKETGIAKMLPLGWVRRYHIFEMRLPNFKLLSYELINERNAQVKRKMSDKNW